MSGEGLHPRRTEILRFLARLGTDERPSVAEIGRAVGLKSTQTAHHHLKLLESGEYIERGEVSLHQRRPVKLTAKGWEAVSDSTPLLGRVAAGPGIEAIVDEGGASSLAADLLVPKPGRRRYTVTATGDSMVGARIEEGDTLLIEENEDPPDGTVVLALLHGERVTVKRLYRDGDTVRLRYQNGEPREIVLPAEEVRIQGEVIRVIHSPGRRR
ncbi:MAG: transcriptional repressor LexA [Rubrobacteraceae bacterium]